MPPEVVVAIVALVSAVIGTAITAVVTRTGSRPDALSSTTITLEGAWEQIARLEHKVAELDAKVHDLHDRLAGAIDESTRLRRALRDLWAVMQDRFPGESLIDLTAYGLHPDDLDGRL